MFGSLSLSYFKEKWSHAGFQRYFQNMGWIFFARIGNLIISFLATSYIARVLGPANYGELSYAISFVSMFSFISVLGIDQVLYRDLIKFPDEKESYLGSALVLRLLASILAIALCVLGAFILSPKDVSFLLILVLSSTFVFNSFQVIGFEFQAHVQAKYPSLQSLIITFLLNILKIVVIAFDQGVIYLALVFVLESVLYAISFSYYRTKIFGSLKKLRFKFLIAKKILIDSWPLIFSSAFAVVYARIDQIMIKNTIDATSVGYYDAAVRLSEVWYFIPSIIATSLFPAIVNSKQISEAVYLSRIRKLILLLTTLSIVIAIPMSLASNFIVTTVFGNQFGATVPILQVYIWSNVWIAMTTVIQLYLINENKRNMLFWSSLVGMITNIILNTVLIPVYGPAGAAVATLISYAIPVVSVFCTRKTRALISFS